MSTRRLLAGAVPLACLASAAHAQEQLQSQGQASSATATPAGQLGEVVVTASRQAQNVQKVSSAVQVIDGAKVKSEGLVNVEQISPDLRSVKVSGQHGGDNIDIHGGAADLPASSGQGSVAMEFDGIYNIQSQATAIGFFEMDRIEAPGPQSTRYAPNVKGGVANVPIGDNFTLYACI
jgi:outer membrane receptor protein involved in Fe transport